MNDIKNEKYKEWIQVSVKQFVRGVWKYATDGDYRFLIDANNGKYDNIPDEDYLRRKFFAVMKQPLHLEDPRTFNEKLQWLKLYNRKPEYTMMVDKYKVREYIKQKIGEEYLIPLLGVWDDPDEIDFDALPNQFVLKCNHNSGLGMCICKDKSSLDIPKVKAGLRKGLKQDYYLTGREWPYKDVPRKIICEQYMQDDSGTGELADYKVLCFNGEPRLVEIHHGRFEGGHTQDFYDLEWNKTDIEQPGYPLSDKVMDKPVFGDEMYGLTKILAKDIPHVRIDWYYSEGHLYFGEMTFFDGSGFSPFYGDADMKLGSWLQLPSMSKNIE